MDYDNRPTFFDAETGSVIRAAGVLFYRRVRATHPLDRIELLVQINHTTQHGFEDLGGKTDPGDSSVFDTAAREVAEETNNVIDRDAVLRQLYFTGQKPICGPRKYALFLVQANSYERRLQTDDFSTIEKSATPFERTVKWVSLKDFLNGDYHVRLQEIIDSILARLLL